MLNEDRFSKERAEELVFELRNLQLYRHHINIINDIATLSLKYYKSYLHLLLSHTF